MHCILEFLFGANDKAIDRASIWTAIAALAAIGAIWVAWYQLGNARKIARADFAKRFVDSYFTAGTREIFALLMNSALEFKVLIITNKDGAKIDQLPYFEIKKSVSDQLKGVVHVHPDKIGYSAFEIDDLLLGHLDDIGWYEDRKLIDMETYEQRQ